ncbi:MAG: hypothetical protein HFG27_02315 [Provencibacterium sp.]|jgi:hypothetical protein|nr:hypothetical protein [Provencibacterium sp.]
MFHKEFFSQMSAAKKALTAALAAAALLVSVLSLLCMSVARLRLKLLRALDEVYQTLPEIRFAAQLYIRQNASEEEKAVFNQTKSRKRIRRR